MDNLPRPTAPEIHDKTLCLTHSHRLIMFGVPPDQSQYHVVFALPNKVTPAEAMILGARWDREMDELLREGVLRYGAEWEDVSTHMTPHECPKEEVEKRYFCLCAFMKLHCL